MTPVDEITEDYVLSMRRGETEIIVCGTAETMPELKELLRSFLLGVGYGQGTVAELFGELH